MPYPFIYPNWNLTLIQTLIEPKHTHRYNGAVSTSNIYFVVPLLVLRLLSNELVYQKYTPYRLWPLEGNVYTSDNAATALLKKITQLL